MIFTMGKEGIILDPDETECIDTIEVILFWTIRATVISTALNPLLYGFLAKQYRNAYKYLLRKLFSNCSSVDPPQESIFCKLISKSILSIYSSLVYIVMWFWCYHNISHL